MSGRACQPMVLQRAWSPPRRSPESTHHPQHLVAVGLPFFDAQTGNAVQIGQRAGLAGGNRAQGGVVKDHERGQVVFLGHPGAPGLERVQGVARGQGERLAIVRHGGAGVARAAGAPGACGLLGQQLEPHGALALQDLARRVLQVQGVVVRCVHLHRLAGDQLAQQRTPLRLGQISADAEGGEFVVPVLRHLLGDLAAQDVHDVAGAEGRAAGLLHAVDARKQLARGLGGVKELRRMQAVVAVAAGFAFFSKVREQPDTPAVAGFRQGQQRVELAAHHLLEFFGRRALVDHAALVHHVLQAIGHPRVGGLRRVYLVATLAKLAPSDLDYLIVPTYITDPNFAGSQFKPFGFIGEACALGAMLIGDTP